MDVCFTIYELPRYLFVSFVSAKTVDKREEELRKCMYVSRISTFGGICFVHEAFCFETISNLSGNICWI